MGTDSTEDPIRREVVAGAVALSLTGGVAGGLYRNGWLDRASRQGTATSAGPAPLDPSLRKVPGAGTVETTSSTAGAGDRVGTAAATGSGAAPAPAAGTAEDGGSGALTETERRLHVARRLTYGQTPEVLDRLEAVGIDAFIDEQLTPGSIDDRDCEARLRPLHRLDDSAASIDERERTPLLGEEPGRALADLRAAALVRAVHSHRQVQELMVELWTDHFNVWADRGKARAEKVVDDRETIRPHALGRFVDLLRASARSPAMLRYLDNRSSRAEHPNENYARELLELHTVGVGNHTEHDVREVARVLTGWTSDDRLRFRFDPERHDERPATAVGWTTPGRRGGAAVEDGEELLDHLARHPGTARNVCGRIARRFVADDPPPALIDRLADVYLRHDTAIVPVLAHLFRSDEFYASAGAKFRRPFEFVAATLRALGADLDAATLASTAAMDHRLQAMGHRSFSWEAPDGYPDVADAWRAPNDVVARWSFVTQVAAGHIHGVAVDLDRHHGSLDGESVGAVADRILASLVGGDSPAHERDALVTASGAADAATLVDEIGRDTVPLMAAVALASARGQVR